MRKAITSVALILILASLINGFLGRDARGNSFSTDLAPESSLQTEAADPYRAEREEAAKGNESGEASRAPRDFDWPSANPVQAPPKTTVMTITPVPEEPTSKTDPITTTTTRTAKATTTTTTAQATTTTTEPRTTTTTTTAKATTTTAEPTTTTTTTTVKATTTTTTNQALKGYFCYDLEAEVIRLVNIERGKEGIGPVTLNQSLRSAAAVRAVEVVDKFSHERPNGERWCTAIKIPYKCAGENIAAGQRTAERVVQAWMNSESHRKNLMNPRYTEVGVACYHDPDQAYRYYWSQLFIGHN